MKRIPPIWRKFEVIAAEAANGWSRPTKSRAGQIRWKAILSDLCQEYVPRLASPEADAAPAEWWDDVQVCVQWIYSALERPGLCPGPKQLEAFKRTIPRLCAPPPGYLDSLPQAGGERKQRPVAGVPEISSELSNPTKPELSSLS